jgi:hypothetical protein
MRANMHPLDKTYAFDWGWLARSYSVMTIANGYIFLDVRGSDKIRPCLQTYTLETGLYCGSYYHSFEHTVLKGQTI